MSIPELSLRLCQMPGVAMASILRLPNVGAEPTLQLPGGDDSEEQRGGFFVSRGSEFVLEQFKGESRCTVKLNIGWQLIYLDPPRV